MTDSFAKQSSPLLPYLPYHSMGTKPHDPDRSRLRVACHDMMSLNNLGSIFRTADGAGFDEIILSGICGTPPQRGLTKVSLGSEDYLNWCKFEDIDNVLEYVADDLIIICEQTPNSIHYQQLDLPNLLAHRPARSITVVLGSEREGTDKRFLDRADAAAEIPMRGHKESLNVANAFTLIAYEIAEQVYDANESHLRGHVGEENRLRRPGLLTNGLTCGEIVHD